MVSSIAIIGAGPSGLLLAHFLQQAGMEYTIFERDESQNWADGRSGSGTLDLHVGSGQLALEKAGLLEGFKARARYDVPTKLARADGTVVARMADEGDTDRPEIDRTDLRKMLLECVPAEKISWNRKVAKITRNEDQTMAIHFVDGSIESGFRLVVGADGAWSKVRNLVTSTVPEYSGFTFLSSKILPTDPAYATAQTLNAKGNYLSFGDEIMCGLMELGNGSYYIAVGLRLPADWKATHAALLADPAAMASWLVRDRLRNWSAPQREVFGHGRWPWYYWPTYAVSTDSLARETVPGVVLVGDAAHLAPPFSGGGVNIALLDSYRLAEQLIKHGPDNMNLAVSEYEKDMLPRAIKYINKSVYMGSVLFAPDAPQGFLDLAGM